MLSQKKSARKVKNKRRPQENRKDFLGKKSYIKKIHKGSEKLDN